MWGSREGQISISDICLAFQVREETGLDITTMLVEEDRIERHIKQQRSKLFIITGVPFVHPLLVLPHRSLRCLRDFLCESGTFRSGWIDSGSDGSSLGFLGHVDNLAVPWSLCL